MKKNVSPKVKEVKQRMQEVNLNLTCTERNQDKPNFESIKVICHTQCSGTRIYNDEIKREQQSYIHHDNGKSSSFIEQFGPWR